MEDKVKAAIEAYGFHAADILPVQPDVWKVITDSGSYCFKRMAKGKERVTFLLAAMTQLPRQGFSRLSLPVATASGRSFLEDGDTIWLATSWVEGCNCLFRQPEHLQAAANTLGLFHRAARGLNVPGGRVSYEAWPGRLARRSRDLERFWQLAEKEDSYFCRRYLMLAASKKNLAEKSLSLLGASDYNALAAAAAASGCFVHWDIAGRNFIIAQDGLAHLIDFDYCRYDLPASDMVRLLERGLLEKDCRMETAVLIFGEYSRFRPFLPGETKLITALLHFPQRYWRLGLRYFKEAAATRDQLSYDNQIDRLIYHNEKEEQCLDYILKHHGEMG